MVTKITILKRRNAVLWDIDKGKLVQNIPHRKQYESWVSRLSQDEVKDIKSEILQRIKGDEIATAGWIPGSDWRGTPFQAIYEKACRFDQDAAAKCFGLIVWVTMMEHEDYWGFGKYELNCMPINSMTYFKVCL